MPSKTEANNSSFDPANPKPKTQNPKLFYWLPPILWMAAIFYFSTDNFSGQKTGSVIFDLLHRFLPYLTEEQVAPLNHLIRKASHFTEYAILSLLLFRAFRHGRPVRWRWQWAASTLVVVAVYALLDEYHQTFTRTRSGSVYDSMIDCSGALVAMLGLWWRRRNSARL